jgi:methylthioribose-1-phosphate isomerase
MGAKGRSYVRVSNPGSRALNPGFDVTPGELVTGLITPLGTFKPKEIWKLRDRLGVVS